MTKPRTPKIEETLEDDVVPEPTFEPRPVDPVLEFTYVAPEFMYYSASTGGWYDYPDNYPESWPADAVQVPMATYDEMVRHRPLDKVVIADENGHPLLIDVPEPVLTREQILQNRMAYYRVESDPLFLEWQYDQTEEKRQAWVDKVTEIKERYPLPQE